ncbi:unnamed protein product [Heligmosomoides polygyrus]|uniref:Uncharacterized protein n=1 Tax=Heligmosomoides polygyrus TaxID=6339 RepID=A0A183G7B2_HELPZ|nr:unnamed protein product [Heligmosomoides polygyrus]
MLHPAVRRIAAANRKHHNMAAWQAAMTAYVDYHDASTAGWSPKNTHLMRFRKTSPRLRGAAAAGFREHMKCCGRGRSTAQTPRSVMQDVDVPHNSLLLPSEIATIPLHVLANVYFFLQLPTH